MRSLTLGIEPRYAGVVQQTPVSSCLQQPLQPGKCQGGHHTDINATAARTAGKEELTWVVAGLLVANKASQL